MKKLLATLLAVTIGLSVMPADAATKKTDTKKTDTKSAPAPAGVTKYDTHLPVEISSDNLEVLQKENKAIFRGNVIAVQGKLRLNSDKMTVHYKQKDPNAKPTPAPAPGAAAPGGDMGAISHIEVEGHVLVASPEETAEGDSGDYDVEKRFLHLIGEHVVLTRGQNILRGKAVDYNLDTGRSVLTNGDESVKGKSGKSDNRVRGVFVPKSDPKAEPKAAPKADSKE